MSVDDLDFNLKSQDDNIEFITRLSPTGIVETNVICQNSWFENNPSTCTTFDIGNIILHPDGLIYIISSIAENGEIVRKIQYYEETKIYKNLNVLDESILQPIAISVGANFLETEEDLVESIQTSISKKCFESLPNVKSIPTVRAIDKFGQEFDDYSGKGLIERLADLDRPNIKNSNDQLKFKKIETFLRAVISNQSAFIEIPNDKSAIIVKINEKRLPLENLGTGISEVIMIATFCTLSEKEIICIEEPETHLHPILQKKLIRYLNDETSNQYFIATHSASFIDTPNAAIFHVYLENNQTMIKEAILNSDKYCICHQLGYKASDILQANSVVWVEGPSELILTCPLFCIHSKGEFPFFMALV